MFFESFYGWSVGCNLWVIDWEFVVCVLEVWWYWSVIDFLVEVLEGVIVVVEGSL